jgi:hypothetical protein
MQAWHSVDVLHVAAAQGNHRAGIGPRGARGYEQTVTVTPTRPGSNSSTRAGRWAPNRPTPSATWRGRRPSSTVTTSSPPERSRRPASG